MLNRGGLFLIINISGFGLRLILNPHFRVRFKHYFYRFIFSCLSLAKDTFLLIYINWFYDRIIKCFFEELAFSLEDHIAYPHSHFIVIFVEQLDVNEEGEGMFPDLDNFVVVRGLKGKRCLAKILLVRIFKS